MPMNLKFVPVVMLVRQRQPENIATILVTFAVLSGVKSRLVKPEQPENIKPIFVTFDVLNDVKSRLIRPEQP